MKCYLIEIDGKIGTKVYLSLSKLCDEHKINYSSAVRGLRMYKGKKIIEAQLIKRKNRGRNI